MSKVRAHSCFLPTQKLKNNILLERCHARKKKAGWLLPSISPPPRIWAIWGMDGIFWHRRKKYHRVSPSASPNISNPQLRLEPCRHASVHIGPIASLEDSPSSSCLIRAGYARGKSRCKYMPLGRSSVQTFIRMPGKAVSTCLSRFDRDGIAYSVAATHFGQM